MVSKLMFYMEDAVMRKE